LEQDDYFNFPEELENADLNATSPFGTQVEEVLTENIWEDGEEAQGS